jgi:hypothetical protein
MRYAASCTSCTLLLLVTATALSAQETKAPWWHFGRDEQPSTLQSNVTPAPTLTPAPETITPIEQDSWFAWPSMPQWHWPQFASEGDATVTDMPAAEAPVTSGGRASRSWNPLGKTAHRTRPRNTWAQQPASSATEAASESPWQSMKASTRSAWDKTVDFVTPGDEAETAVVASKPRSSWWKRMWGSDESNEGPQTVTEWMAQDRIDP